jgi:hypothetical protein
MTKFTPIEKKPGELIRSEDWNKIQQDVKTDMVELENMLQALRAYVNNMEQSSTMRNMDSTIGKSYALDEVMPGESSSYEAPVIGVLTRQWLLPQGKTGEICKFGVVSLLEAIDYWAGAEKGNLKALELTFNYIDGTSAVVSQLFVHDRVRLRSKGTDNPYLEYLLSPNEYVWYRYQVVNPNPQKEVLNITFNNIIEGCTPRLGNVIHYRSKITPRRETLK